MRLADNWQERWDRRRQFEWTFTFATWATIGIAAVCAYCSVAIPIAVPALIVLGHAYVVTRAHLKNARDDNLVLHLRREAESMAHRSPVLPEKTGPVGGWRTIAAAFTDYSTAAQIIPTALAAYVTIDRLWSGPLQ